jgi:hypothetical protein
MGVSYKSACFNLLCLKVLTRYAALATNAPVFSPEEEQQEKQRKQANFARLEAAILQRRCACMVVASSTTLLLCCVTTTVFLVHTANLLALFLEFEIILTVV